MKEKVKKFKKEFKKEIVTAILAALGFLIALSWRDFISEAVNKAVKLTGVSDHLYLFKLVTAVIVTIIAVIGIMIISKFKSEQEGND